MTAFDETFAGEEELPAFLKEVLRENLFAQVREVRRASGLSREEIAEQMGTTTSALARLERGLLYGKCPSMRTLERSTNGWSYALSDLVPTAYPQYSRLELLEPTETAPARLREVEYEQTAEDFRRNARR